jgi:hypothetical protein
MPARALPAAGIRPGDSHYRSDLAGARAGKDLEARWDDAKAGLKPRTATDCHSVAIDIGQMQAGHHRSAPCDGHDGKITRLPQAGKAEPSESNYKLFIGFAACTRRGS